MKNKNALKYVSKKIMFITSKLTQTVHFLSVWHPLVFMGEKMLQNLLQTLLNIDIQLAFDSSVIKHSRCLACVQSMWDRQERPAVWRWPQSLNGVLCQIKFPPQKKSMLIFYVRAIDRNVPKSSHIWLLKINKICKLSHELHFPAIIFLELRHTSS